MGCPRVQTSPCSSLSAKAKLQPCREGVKSCYRSHENLAQQAEFVARKYRRQEHRCQGISLPVCLSGELDITTRLKMIPKCPTRSTIPRWDYGLFLQGRGR